VKERWKEEETGVPQSTSRSQPNDSVMVNLDDQFDWIENYLVD
jgi:hypothetical protein